MKKLNMSTIRNIGYVVSVAVAVAFWIAILTHYINPDIKSGQPFFLIYSDEQMVVNDNIVDGGSGDYFELRPLNNPSIPPITAKLELADIGQTADYYYVREEPIKAGRYTVISGQTVVTLSFHKEVKVPVYRNNLDIFFKGVLIAIPALMLCIFLCVLNEELTKKPLVELKAETEEQPANKVPTSEAQTD